MARYIDADKTVWSVTNNDKYGTITKNVFVSLLQNADTADVAPVVHAHWIGETDDLFPADSMVVCSNCGEYEYLTASGNYCGNCGAKMDEEVEL